MVQLLEFFLRLDCIGVHTLAYRPASLNDWPESEREGKKKSPGQKDLTALAVGRILALSDSAFTSWISELAKLQVSPDEEMPFRAVAQMVGAGLGRLKMLDLSMGID
jgi:hypothetical protein